MPQHLTALVRRAAVVSTGTAAVALVALLPATGAAPAAASPSATASAPTVTVPVRPVAVTAPTRAGVRSAALQFALGKIGSPYRWGAAGPHAFDCSGLVNWAYRQAGVTLPRTSAAMSRVGTPVSRSDLQPGDLVFFYSPISHVAIYVGGGMVVHASTAGVPVKTAPLSAMPMTAARRV